MRAWRERNPTAQQSYDYKKYYGVGIDWVHQKLQEQGGVCAICKKPETAMFKGKPFTLAVDHDHSTNKLRGLLCMSCNRGLGLFKDDSELLLAASQYLKNHKEI